MDHLAAQVQAVVRVTPFRDQVVQAHQAKVMQGAPETAGLTPITQAAAAAARALRERQRHQELLMAARGELA